MINRRSSNSKVKCENNSNVVVTTNNNNNNTTFTNPSLPIEAPCGFSSHPHVCTKHSKATDIKCNTCSKLICYKCLYECHLNHNHTLLVGDITENDRQEYNETYNKSIDVVRKRKLAVEETIKDVEEKAKKSKDDIKNMFNEFHLQLQNKEDLLCLSVSKMQQDRIDPLKNEIQFLDNNLQQLCAQTQLNNLGTNSMDLEINKFILKDNDTKINNLVLNNPLHKYDKFYFQLNKAEISSKLDGINVEIIPEFSVIEFVEALGSRGSASAQFEHPRDILIDSGLIYIADEENYRISVFSLNNKRFIKQIALGFQPSCLKLDKKRNYLYIGDRNTNSVYRFNYNTDTFERQYSNTRFYNHGITGIEVDEYNGFLYITSNSYSKIQVLSKYCSFIREFESNLKGPWGVVLNNKNELVVTDCDDNKIKLFTKNGQFIKSIENSELNRPSGIYYDNYNKQYIVCNFKNDSIHIYNDNFNLIKSFGKYGNGNNEFNFPSNVAIDYNTKQLYIVDCWNHCIKIFRYLN